MTILFIKKIPEGFTPINGIREPYYGDNNEIIGFRLYNRLLKQKKEWKEDDSSIIFVVASKEKQFEKYHKQVYEQIQDCLETKDTRTLEITISRRAWLHIECLLAKRNSPNFDAVIEEAILSREE